MAIEEEKRRRGTKVPEGEKSRSRTIERTVELPEVTEETRAEAREYIARLKDSGRRFDHALREYQELLKLQENKEADLDEIKEAFKTEIQFEALKAKATKLLWATMRHATSSSIVATGVAAETYAQTGDVMTTVVAAAAGALTGTAVELALSKAEEENDASEEYFARHPETAAYIAKKRQRKEEEAKSGERIEGDVARLQAEIAIVQEDLTRLSGEIDRLAGLGLGLRLSKPESKSVSAMSPEDARLAVKKLAEELRTAGERMNTLLAEYHEMTQGAEGMEKYLEAQERALAIRDVTVQTKALARKAWEVAKEAHMVVGLSLMFGMGGYVMSALGQHQTEHAIAGAAFGAGIGWFFSARWEKNVLHQNIPYGQHATRNRLAADVDLQRYLDPELNARQAILEATKLERDRLEEEQKRLSTEIDEFTKKFPMK